ncbi:SHOCT domain-containing protein [Mucilaginibacter mali]|uniref:SHOCT domain-containing protein n=1 Tax=Mucilaginibacter mali TaxID=2740462 RepID=A0A7D4QEU2_9SPHI|nr:SHOCT domain-containing protein [Mucilaginibacter mali]QKJ29892.1 SHOCT domain-containing protein [Mucilaginibacter mali]
MKKILLTAALFVPLFALAQDIKEYKATNGVTYHINDTVHLGKGSNSNGSFMFVQDRGLGFTLPGPPGRTAGGRGLPKDLANGGVIIRSIKKTTENNLEKYVFMVYAGGPLRFTLFIDDAISVCEVTPCKQSSAGSPVPVASVADEIKKLKQLMDSGAITKEEYESRKKKLLDQ